jgi:hypothetical protein
MLESAPSQTYSVTIQARPIRFSQVTFKEKIVP